MWLSCLPRTPSTFSSANVPLTLSSWLQVDGLQTAGDLIFSISGLSGSLTIRMWNNVGVLELTCSFLPRVSWLGAPRNPHQTSPPLSWWCMDLQVEARSSCLCLNSEPEIEIYTVLFSHLARIVDSMKTLVPWELEPDLVPTAS